MAEQDGGGKKVARGVLETTTKEIGVLLDFNWSGEKQGCFFFFFFFF